MVIMNEGARRLDEWVYWGQIRSRPAAARGPGCSMHNLQYRTVVRTASTAELEVPWVDGLCIDRVNLPCNIDQATAMMVLRSWVMAFYKDILYIANIGEPKHVASQGSSLLKTMPLASKDGYQQQFLGNVFNLRCISSIHLFQYRRSKLCFSGTNRRYLGTELPFCGSGEDDSTQTKISRVSKSLTSKISFHFRRPV